MTRPLLLIRENYNSCYERRNYSMEELLETLERLYAEQNNAEVHPKDGWTYFKDNNELYQKVISLCCEHLITANGGCNWDNINILRNNGYRVFAGDRDSFGWLTGCVQKNNNDKRTVVYG